MSIILDALKKSENERRRQERPGFADLPNAAPRKPMPPWILLSVGAVSALLVAVSVAFFYLQAGAVMTPEDTGVAAARPAGGARSASALDDDPWAEDPARDDTPMLPPERSVRSLAREVPSTPPPASTSAGSETRRGAGMAVPTPPPTAPANAAGTASPTANLPSADELAARGELTIPDLHMDLHVYDTDPAQRFVFINGRRLRQGDEVSQDLRVQEILAEGVVLQQGSTRFILPRD